MKKEAISFALCRFVGIGFACARRTSILRILLAHCISTFSHFRIILSDELWQVAYLACVGRMTEEKERKIKASYYDLRHRLGEQEADGREAERNNATDEEPKERKRKRLMHWVKSHVSDEALHHHHHTQEPALSWRELTKARHLKAKKLAAIKLKVNVSALAPPPLSGRPGTMDTTGRVWYSRYSALQPLEVPQGEVLLELVSNSEAPDGVLRVRYLNSADPNVAELSDTSRVCLTQDHTSLTDVHHVHNDDPSLRTGADRSRKQTRRSCSCRPSSINHRTCCFRTLRRESRTRASAGVLPLLIAQRVFAHWLTSWTYVSFTATSRSALRR